MIDGAEGDCVDMCVSRFGILYEIPHRRVCTTASSGSLGPTAAVKCSVIQYNEASYSDGGIAVNECVQDCL